MKSNPFIHNTYIILDFPEKIAQEIIKIRSEFDLFRASLPAEITLTGSSGVGILSKEQEPEDVFRKINHVATSIPPIEVKLGEVRSFPNTNIYYLSVRFEEKIRELHNKLISTGIRFEEIPFPYTPHCTISSRDDLLQKQIEELKEVRV